MSDLISTSVDSSTSSMDEGVYAPWEQNRANHAFISGRLPAWYTGASTALRAALRKSQTFNSFSRRDLAPLRKQLKSVEAFAEPLLEKALFETFGLHPDVHRNVLVTPHDVTFTGVVQSRPLKRSLLQAALQNFEEYEAQPGGFDPGAALLPEDGLQLHLVGGTRQNGSHPRFRYRYCGLIKIKPDQFAGMCRRLDLGAKYQKHLDGIFKPVALPDKTAEERALEVAGKFQSSEKDSVQVLAHIALMKNHISPIVYEMLLALTTAGSTPMWGARPIRQYGLQMLDAIGETGSLLSGALLIEPDETDQSAMPCLVYMPGEPDHPLKEYVSFDAFTDTLRRKLATKDYQSYFRCFISVSDSPRFFKRLNERLTTAHLIDLNPLASTLLFNNQADLALEKVATSGAPFQMLYEHLLQRTYGDSRFLAVPTDDEDQKTRADKLNRYESWGLDLLTIASFFIPVLGAFMAVIAVEQVLSDIFIGFHEWEDGEIDEALGHMSSAAENVALAVTFAAVGKAYTAAFKSTPSAFVENMVPVKLKTGQARLWKADSAPFQQDSTLPNWVRANNEGRVEVTGKSHLTIAGKQFQIEFDGGLKQWRLKHPTNIERYSPVLTHNGAGAWRLEGENPMGWDMHTAFKRLHPALDPFPETAIERVMAVTQGDEALLRQVHVENIKPPALLSDSIARFQIQHQIDGFIAAMKSGNAQDIRWPHIGPYIELLAGLPGWPKQRSVRLLDQNNAVLKVFGRSGATLPSIDVHYMPGQLDDVMSSTLAALQPEEREALLGDYNSVLQGQNSRLSEQLGEMAELRRASLHESIYQMGSSSDGPLAKLIKRDFPSLPTVVVDEIIESASTREVAHMTATSRLPLRIAEEVREYLQQLRLNRVNECFYFQGADHPDIAPVTFHLLPRLPGWPKHLALEIRESMFSGSLIDSLGDSSANLRRVLVKSGERYQTFDSMGNAVDDGGHRFFGALLQALPVEERSALGLSGAAQELQLREAVGAVAVSQRGEVASALDMHKIKPGFKSPQRLADGRVGYPLSGRIRRLFSRFGIGARNHSAELAVTNLFPGMESAEVRTFIAELGADFTGRPSGRMAYVQAKIRTLELQHEQLSSGLDLWLATPADAQATGNALELTREDDRRLAASRILACWRRFSPRCYSGRGRFLGYTLNLNQLMIGELPLLNARFDHVSALFLNDVGFNTQTADILLRQFNSVHQLHLRGNGLTSLPESLTELIFLRHLSLRGNPLVLDQAAVNRLQNLTHLHTLNLNYCPIGPLLNVGSMRELVRLSVRSTGITDLPAGLAGCLDLAVVDARNNQIVELPESLFSSSRLIYRRIQLHDNPLGQQTLDRVRRFLNPTERRLMGMSDDRLHAAAELSPFSYQLTDLPGAGAVRSSGWIDLQAEPDSADFFRVLRDLTASADYASSRQNLTQRVWAVINAASTYGDLREELFTLAAHPQTCGDGVMLVFSDLEIRVMVFNVMLPANAGLQESKLFELARGLDRLDEVEKLAREDIAFRSLNDPALDQAEVRLAYRVGLAQRLKLPLQPQGMLFSRLAGVTDEAINAAEQHVLERENAPVFYKSMITRDFWMQYLQKQYATDFEPVQAPFHERLNELDDHAYTSLRTDEYLTQIAAIQKARSVATDQLALNLTRTIAAKVAAEKNP